MYVQIVRKCWLVGCAPIKDNYRFSAMLACTKYYAYVIYEYVFFFSFCFVGYAHMNGDVGKIPAGHQMYTTTHEHYSNMSVVGGTPAGDYG